MGGGVLTFLFIATALLSFIWTPYDVSALDIAGKLQPPSSLHLFGTDQLGRDVLSMVMVGARNSLAVALAAA